MGENEGTCSLAVSSPPASQMAARPTHGLPYTVFSEGGFRSSILPRLIPQTCWVSSALHRTSARFPGSVTVAAVFSDSLSRTYEAHWTSAIRAFVLTSLSS